MKIKPVALVILDGFGETKEGPGNAVKLAKTPNLDKWTKEYPHTYINASGHFVGLPDGQMGNSEVGHLNIGAGRIIFQSLALINQELAEGKLIDNYVFLEAIEHAKSNKTKVNLIGLVSDGGVHSHVKHIIAFAKLIKAQGAEVVVHAFTDGRDTAQKSALKYLKQLADANIKIGSISGRYYGMDRDQRWERVQLAYDAIVNRKGETFTSLEDFVDREYAKGITDEFFTPSYNKDEDLSIKDNDAIISMNFRPDRARELAHMLIGSNEAVTKYDYEIKRLKNIFYISTRGYAGIECPVIWPNDEIEDLLGITLEKAGLTQMRAAETEKYPHVTFFMDGGKEVPLAHETRILVHSPKVATYDMQPQMSCEELTDHILKAADHQDVFLINFAQPDMVGHTGQIPAVIKAIEEADKDLGRLYKKVVEELGGVMLITADHGNSEVMLEEDGKTPQTKHTTNKVRLIITSHAVEFNDYAMQMDANGNPVNGKLADLAPTILKLVDVKIPKLMTGTPLIK